MVETANIVWADGPSGNPYEPEKPQIRAWGTWLENLTSSLGMAVTAAYVRGTKAQLDGVVSAEDGEVGIVVADDDPDLRGIYVRVGSSWLKKLELPVDAAALLLEQTEDARDLALDYRDDARDARDAAENFRDQAAGYVNDIASEKEVPIYGTVDGMSAIAVPVGILTINILGRSGMLDSPMSTWKRVSSEPDVPPKLKFRTTDRFLPNGSTSSSNGGWWLYQMMLPRADQMTGVWTPQKRLNTVMAMMAAGLTVNLAVFTDSTGDGNGTTGWTANPVDGDGNAIGTTDHAATAPNAWPAKLQALLRAMYANNNINVWNAGYSGTRISDGWARRNYRRAVVDNPAYGVPHLTILTQGLNDGRADGSQVPEYTEEQRLLVRDILSDGTVPIMGTCIPAPRNTPGFDNRETSRQIDSVKVGNGAELDIPVIDINRACLAWLNGNTDGHRWFEVQPDYLHFGDTGHAFVAEFVASQLFRDVVYMTGARRAISPMAAESGSGHDSSVFGPGTDTNGKYSGNWIFLAGALPLNTPTIDTWVWCETPKASVVYRGFDGDTGGAGYASGMTAGPPIEIISEHAGTTTRRPAGIGFARAGSSGFRRADLPSVIGKLPWGLSRIRYKVGSAQVSGGDQCYVGYVELLPFAPTEARNALKQSGPLMQSASSGSGLLLYPADDAADGCNTFGASGTNEVNIYADLVLPVGSGFIYATTPGYGAVGQVQGDKSCSMIFRQSATEVRLYPVCTVAGVVSFGTLVASGTVPSGDAIRLRISIARVGDDQVTKVFGDWVTTTALATGTIPYSSTPLHFGGVCGGFFFNRTFVAGTVLAEIKALKIVQS